MPTQGIYFHGRKTLCASTGLTISGSTQIGVYECSGFSRFTGMILNTSSLTIRYGMQINSGTTQITSSFAVNSGGAVFDVLNHGRFVDFHVSAANSGAGVAILILGEPLR